MDKYSMRLLMTALMIALSSLMAQAQLKVTGTVKDQTGLEVIGASVLEKGTTNGTITNIDGQFELTVQSGATLVVSYIGYVSQGLKATPQMTITLKEDSQTLDEVVVVGYGVQKKSVVTGAISSVKAEDMITSANTRPEQALQGKTSGVQVLSTSGTPGGSMKIRVRGYSSNGCDGLVRMKYGTYRDEIPNSDESYILVCGTNYRLIRYANVLSFYIADLDLVLEPGVFEVMVGSSSADCDLHRA